MYNIYFKLTSTYVNDTSWHPSQMSLTYVLIQQKIVKCELWFLMYGQFPAPEGLNNASVYLWMML